MDFKNILAVLPHSTTGARSYIFLFLSLGFPWSFHTLYFCLAGFSDNRISGVHTFNFGLALNIDSLQINENMEETAIEQVILKLCEPPRETATLTASATTFNAKPKLKVWTPEIRLFPKHYVVFVVRFPMVFPYFIFLPCRF
jgi:hypothetical protein